MANHLEDLVLGALQETKEETLNPLDIIEGSKTLSPGVLSEKLQEGALEIEANSSSSWDVVCRSIAWIIKNEGQRTFYSPASKVAKTNKSLPLLLRAQRADREDVEYVCQWLRETSDSLLEEERNARRRAAVGSFASSITYLSDYWGESTEESLSKLTSSAKATVRRWMQGGSAQWNNANKVQSVAKVFYELENKGWSREDITRWWEKPLASGNSPAELLRQSSYSWPDELKSEVLSHGISI